MKRTVAGIAWIALVAFVCLEIELRRRDDPGITHDATAAFVRPDPRLGWNGRAEVERWVDNGTHDVFVATDASGFRRPEGPSASDAEHRILLLGGSDTWGRGIGQGRSVSDWLRAELPAGVEVVNRALPGVVLAGFRDRLMEALEEARFDEVVIVIGPNEPSYWWRDASTESSAALHLAEVWGRISDQSLAVRFLGRRLVPGAGPTPTRLLGSPPTEIVGEIERIHDAVRAAGGQLVVAHVPSAETVSARRFRETGELRDSLSRAAEERGFRFVDTSFAFALGGAKHDLVTPIGSWSERSHYIIARVLLDRRAVGPRIRPLYDGFHFAPGDPRLQITGRIDWSEPGRARFDWPGVAIGVRILGAEIRFRLKSEKRHDHFEIFVDGARRGTWTSRRAPGELVVDNLGPGIHEVQIVKRSPARHPVVFEGAILTPDAELLAPPATPKERVEILGASFAGGYGVDGTQLGFGNRGMHERPCADLHRMSDATRSYAAVLASRLGVEVRSLTRTGGEIAPREPVDGTPVKPPMARVFERTLASQPGPEWPFAEAPPVAVIVDLGENDFNQTKRRPVAVEPTALEAAYDDLIDDLRQRYPDAVLVSVSWNPGSALTPMIQRIVDRRRDAGDDRIDLVEFGRSIRADERACAGHPSPALHVEMANRLMAPVRRAIDLSRSEATPPEAGAASRPPSSLSGEPPHRTKTARRSHPLVPRRRPYFDDVWRPRTNGGIGPRSPFASALSRGPERALGDRVRGSDHRSPFRIRLYLAKDIGTLGKRQFQRVLPLTRRVDSPASLEPSFFS